MVRGLVYDEEVRAGRDDESECKPPTFPAGQRDDGLLVLAPAGEEKAAEQALRIRPLQACRALDALKDGTARVELHLLLREVRRDDAVTEPHGSGLRLALLEDRLQQRRLAGAVRAYKR